MKNIKTLLKKRWAIPVAILLIITAVSAGKNIIGNAEEVKEEYITKKQVRTVSIDLQDETSSFIEAVGAVKAEAQVDVLSTARGTLRGLFFEVGDEISLNQTLASLHDTSVLISLNNAQTNLSNTENSLKATERITTETIAQAEIGIKNAEEAVNAAEIGLKTTNDNLENAKALRVKSDKDTKNSAIISYSGFLNTILSSLDNLNSVLKADQLLINPNQNLLDPGLGAKDSNSLRQAQSTYRNTKESYESIKNIALNENNIKTNIGLAVDTLNKTEEAVNAMITLLENSVSGQNLTQATIDSQKSSFISLRSQIIASTGQAKTIEQSLENLNLSYNQEISAYENAVSSSETQLMIAQTNLENAKVSLENVKQGRSQQIIGSQSSLDNARGQYNLAQSSVSDLYIKAPIKGTITGKYVELGAEINPGQKIAQISQTEMLKIVINLPSEEIYRIKIGSEIIIGDGLKATLGAIDPAADPITRKVKVEILYNNSNKDLIQGTFIDVVIPAKNPEKTHSESVFIPLRTVITTQTESYVFVIENNIAKKRIVALGKAEGALIEIINGLSTGDILVVEGGKSLEEGDEIETIN